MDRKNVPYMPKIGTRCSVRGETGHWRVINYVHEGIVEKCVLQSFETGQIVRKYNFEVTEISSSSYDDINLFLDELASMSSEEMDRLFNESFESDTIQIQTLPPLLLNELPEVKTKERFKSCTLENVDYLRAQNTEPSTNKQTNKMGQKITPRLEKCEYNLLP